MNPGGGSGRDEPPLDIQIPDDARELDREVIAYHREQRARRRRTRLRKLTAPFGGQGTIMPLLASILAVCLVAGAMLSVATFGPSTAPANRPTSASHAPATAASLRSASRSSAATAGGASASASAGRAATRPASRNSSSSSGPSGTANSPARSGSPSQNTTSGSVPAATP